jgi:hypothetical protein
MGKEIGDNNGYSKLFRYVITYCFHGKKEGGEPGRVPPPKGVVY